MTEISRDPRKWVSLIGEKPTAILDHFGGVGLIRSEFFARRVLQSVLRQDVQDAISAYLDAVCTALAGREVWFRTADLWSDEANVLAGTQRIVEERNPILGVRGIRRSFAMPDEFMAECRILAEVSTRHDNLGVLFPFVADEAEFARAFRMAREVGVKARLGSMIEIPSAAMRAAEIIDAGASILLVGMNDLSCLTVGRERSAGFGDKLHPATEELVTMAVKAAHGRSVRCGVAGSLSVDVIAMAERCGADYVTIHYSQARQLLGVGDDRWPDEGLELEIKLGTRDRIREFARARLDLGGADQGAEPATGLASGLSVNVQAGSL